MRVDRWSVRCTIYEVESAAAVPRAFLTDARDDGFCPRSAIIVGGMPRRACKAKGSADGKCLTPYAVRQAMLDYERMIPGYELTYYDETYSSEASVVGDDAIAQFGAYHAEAAASTSSHSRKLSDLPTLHVFAWGCIAATVPVADCGLKTVRALREVVRRGDDVRFEPLAMIACDVELADAGGPCATISFRSGSNVWSGTEVVLSRASDAHRVGAVAAAQANAEWLAATLRFYLLASSGLRFDWELDTGGAPECAGAIGKVLHARLGPAMAVHAIVA